MGVRKTLIDLTGRIFHSWTVLKKSDTYNKNIRWLCRCECGKEQEVFGNALLHDKSKSCGCKRLELRHLTQGFDSRKCSVEGCTRKYYGVGVCSYHYQIEWRKTHPQGDPTKKQNVIDMTGQKVGLLTVVSRHGVTGKKGYATWSCLCECGKTVVVAGRCLRNGSTKSCGCWHTVRHKAAHENVIRPEYRLLLSAKSRANKRGLPFNIDIDDIPIPEYCPLLGIPLRAAVGGYVHANSPTVDRIEQSKGYTKGNVCVVSWRANTLKNDASLEELELLVNSLRKKMKEFNGQTLYQLAG